MWSASWSPPWWLVRPPRSTGCSGRSSTQRRTTRAGSVSSSTRSPRSLTLQPWRCTAGSHVDSYAGRMSQFLVIGGGLAGAKAVETLRSEGFDGEVVVLSGEKLVPYERPPLSKGFLLGKDSADKAQVHGPEWYATHEVDLRLDTWAASIDLAARSVTLEAGDVLAYDPLLIATGAFPRKLAVPGADGSPLHYLRSLSNSERLRADLQPGGRRVVVIGGGWIGLEVAAAARTYDNEVTVIEPQAAPLQAALGQEMG